MPRPYLSIDVYGKVRASSIHGPLLFAKHGLRMQFGGVVSVLRSTDHRALAVGGGCPCSYLFIPLNLLICCSSFITIVHSILVFWGRAGVWKIAW